MSVSTPVLASEECWHSKRGYMIDATLRLGKEPEVSALHVSDDLWVLQIGPVVIHAESRAALTRLASDIVTAVAGLPPSEGSDANR